MNIQTFGRDLAELLAERSLEVLRGTSAEDLRRVMGSPAPDAVDPPGFSFLGTLGVVVLGAAVAAGLTALYTPTSGPQLRRKLSARTADARERVREQLDDARTTLALGVEQVSSAVGLAPAEPSSPVAQGKSNGHAPRARRPRSVPPPAAS